MITIFPYDEYSNTKILSSEYLIQNYVNKHVECVRKCKGVVISPDLPFFITFLEMLNI
jgi:hypothetical protein